MITPASLNFFKFGATDFAEHTHAIHVCAYAITLAKRLGFRQLPDVVAIGTGALLHDIGKSKIDRALLDKPGLLDSEQRTEMDKHVEWGYQIAKDNSEIVPELSQTIIRQHHERPKGRGYPRKLDSEIHLASKIVAISDTFDALTTERPYQKKLNSMDAAKKMAGEMKDEFEPAILINFIRSLQG